MAGLRTYGGLEDPLTEDVDEELVQSHRSRARLLGSLVVVALCGAFFNENSPALPPDGPPAVMLDRGPPDTARLAAAAPDAVHAAPPDAAALDHPLLAAVAAEDAADPDTEGAEASAEGVETAAETAAETAEGAETAETADAPPEARRKHLRRRE
mmetsp:Transcript_18390/g.54644  ORF Transcript_18390/g.54644 Transcript_18390/m.54644 type:complete len:155 (-) Transcript_18390:387-851(-)